MRVPRRIDSRRDRCEVPRFNKAHDYKWQADCVVTEFKPGRRFTYEVPPGYQHATTWSYSIEADGDGCVVTESFHAPVLATPDVYPGKIEGRRDNLERGSEKTMANLKAVFEN